MSLIVHSKLDELYQHICSKKFISKIFLLENKNNIQKLDNGRRILFNRIYNYKDLHNIEAIAVPDNVTSLIETNMQNIQIIMETVHEIIKHTEKCFIVKYTSILRKPEYIYNFLGETKIILYVQFTVNNKDPNLTVIHFNKKLVHPSEIDDDTIIIDSSNNDIITNIYQQDKLHISESVISISETLFGYNLVHDFMIPFINNIFNTVFDILQDVYVLRFIRYMNKKKIEIFKKKDH